jgi:hypothetical protein
VVETLALSRSRFYQYEIRPGVWEPDATGDLGRIQRQNVVIEALIDKARSTYNPLTLNAFIGSVVNDVKIGGLSSGALLSLALKYHGFSGSHLQHGHHPHLRSRFGGRQCRGRRHRPDPTGDLPVPGESPR